MLFVPSILFMILGYVGDLGGGQCPLYAKACAYKIEHHQKRALGVAKRPREISSAQARRQNSCFFWKNAK